MSETPLHNQPEELKKPTNTTDFDAYFANERAKEEKNNRTAIIVIALVAVVGPIAIYILYLIFVFGVMLAGGKF